MSGICGIIRFDGMEVRKNDIQNLLNSIQNRGNDDENIWVKGNVAFGHKMLWSTPESLHEKQPLISKDGHQIVITDARIDNRDELFEKLNIMEQSDSLITDSDLILWAYQKWGKECPKFIRGDFAFAIFDTIKNELFCSRDRIGLKPFNYYINKDYFIFSSEVNALFSILSVKKEENINALKTYISNWSIPRDETFYKNIKRLPSSSSLSLNLDDNTHVINRFWFPEKIKINKSISFDDATKKFSLLFKQAVQSNMRSAYPIAFEVSGGLDSSSVLCIGLTIKSKQPIVPYTLHYKNLPCDEIEYINAIEDEKNIKILKIDVNNFDYQTKYNLKYIFKYTKSWPAGGPWIEHVAKNSILIKRNIRVVLTGLGGDEVLHTNQKYFEDYRKERKYWKVAKEIICMEYSFLQKMKLILSFFFPLLKKLKKTIISVKNKKKLLDNHEKKINIEEVINKEDFLYSQYQYNNTMTGLGSIVSYWADMNPTQFYGKDNIECRHPFYDTRLMEFLFSLPPEYRYKCGVYKSILRASMQDILPDKIRTRKDKAYFWTNLLKQIQEWNIDNFLSNSILIKKNLLNQEDIDDLVKTNKYNKSKKTILLWIYLNLDGWYNENFKKDI